MRRMMCLSLFVLFLISVPWVMRSDAAKVEIELWHRWGGPNMEVLQEVLREFGKRNAEVAVKEVSVPGQYSELMQKVLARLAAKQNPPDVLLPGYNFMDYTIRELRPIPIAQLGGAEAKAVLDRYPPPVLRIGQLDGTQYGLPYALSVAVLYYNPKLIELAGLNPQAPPRTWAETQAWAEAVKKKTGKPALFISNVDTFLMQTLIESAGGIMLDNRCPAFNTGDAAEAMQAWRKYYQDGLIPRVTHREAEQSFVSGDIAMIATSIMYLRGYSQQATFPLQVTYLPRFGQKSLKAAAGGAALVVLARTAERQKATWELLKYMTSEEGMRIWVKTGYLNPLKFSLPPIKGQEPAYAQLPNLVAWTSWPGSRGLEVDKRVLNWRDKILFGEIGTKEGLDSAVKEVTPLIPGCAR
jgi:multiple sugar transport system substrate-binding protein